MYTFPVFLSVFCLYSDQQGPGPMPTNTTITVRTTDTERAAFRRLVDRLNAADRRLHHRRITPSSLLRGCVRSLLDTDLLETDPALVAELHELNNQLRRIGTNLNQLAHAYHRGLLTTTLDATNLFTTLQAAVLKTQASILAVVEAAGGKGMRLQRDALRHLD